MLAPASASGPGKGDYIAPPWQSDGFPPSPLGLGGG